MTVTTPKLMEVEFPTLAAEIAKFEALLVVETKGLNTYKISIEGMLDKDLRNKIADIYFDAGWRDVTCRTPNEFPGTTLLTLKR
jgi:hypothetical protein